MAQIQAQQQTIDMGAQAAGLVRSQTRGSQSLIRLNDRDIVKIEEKAKLEANLLGSLAFYAWGTGKDRIEGPSWELAKALIRVYGNCSLDMDPVQDLVDSWIMTARVVDLETGYSISRQFRQSKKWQVHGRFDEARKDDIRFQIGQSKSLRNVVLSFLPGWLVNRAIDIAKGGVREAIELAIGKHGADKVIAKCIERCERIGVDEARLLDTMGRKSRQAITVEDLVILQGGISAIESGQDTVDSVFPIVTVEAEEPRSRTQEVLTKLRGGKSTETAGEAPESAKPSTPAAPGAEPDEPPFEEAPKSLGGADAKPPRGHRPTPGTTLLGDELPSQSRGMPGGGK